MFLFPRNSRLFLRACDGVTDSAPRIPLEMSTRHEASATETT